MTESKDEILKDAEDKMRKAVSVNLEELSTIRSGRATPALLHRVTVEYYGAQVPLQQVANLAVPEPRLLVISPYDSNSIAAIEKAILASDLGITPSNDGTVVRLAFPQLTEERRRELIKLAHSRAEEGRVAVRGVRRHAKQHLEHLKKDHLISGDDEHHAESVLQKLTDGYISQIEENLQHKEAELSEV